MFIFPSVDSKSPFHRDRDRSTVKSSNNKGKRPHLMHESDFESDHSVTATDSVRKISEHINANGEYKILVKDSLNHEIASCILQQQHCFIRTTNRIDISQSANVMNNRINNEECELRSGN